MNYKIKLIFILIMFGSLAGCVKEKFDSNKLSKSYMDDMTVAVPIGYASTDLREVLAPQLSSGILVEEADGSLRFKLEQGFITILASDLIQFPEFDSTYSIVNNTGQAIDLNPAGVQKQVVQSFSLDFGYSKGQKNEEIDSILLNNMDMDLNVNATGILNASMNITFPGVNYNKLQYSKNLVVSSSNIYSDLMAYTVHLQNSGAKKNQLKLDIALKMGQTARTIAAGEKIADLHVHFSAIDYEVIYGYVGQININPASIIDERIDMLNDKLSGCFNFDKAYVDLSSKNSIGVPISMQLDNYSCRTYYKPTGLPVFQETASPSDVLDIPFPSLSQFGQMIESENLISTGTVHLGFQDYYSLVSDNLSGIANPKGKQEYNFIRKSSQLEISTGLSVPFYGNTDNLLIKDTISMKLAGFFNSTYTDIERLVFVMNFTNALPMDSKTQIYFCNAAGTRLDSMFTSPCQINGSSTSDSNGKVSPEPNSPVKVEFPSNRLAGIEQTSYLFVISELETVDVKKSPPISWKFFNDYYFYVHVGVAATIKQ